jgi:hypothetical protein
MKKTTLYAVALVVVLALLAGVLVWQKGQKQTNIQNQTVQQSSEGQPESNPQNEGESEGVFSPQHIVAIPGSQQVWYEVPEMGIKLLLSKEAAEELVYRYYVVNGFVTVNPITGEEGALKEIKTIIFSLKKIIDYNQQCDTGLCGTEEMLFAIAKVPGVYHSEPLAFGSKFLKQFKGFYLITGGIPQAVPFANDEEEKKFNDAVGRFLPKIPRLQDIHIGLLEVN